MDAKRKEADENMAKGEERLKTSLFRRKPDWLGAIDFFDRAGICYKNCQDKPKSMEAYKKLSTCHENIGGYASAAKALENASALTDDAVESANILEAAARLYQVAQTSERAAEVLVKAAKILEKNDVTRAITFMTEAAEIIEDQERYHMARDAFISALTFVARNRDYDSAIKILERQARIFAKLDQPKNKWKAQLSIIVLLLAKDDFSAADDSYESFVKEHDFSSSDEWFTATDLLHAYEQANTEALDKVKESPHIISLENCIIKVLKELKITGGPKPRKHHVMGQEEEFKDENDIL
eukprot:c6984_g1_i2.p1 GENE.c6984_g1_i2~~c6984_g1_i2.p1  ORF type:complete len:297 (+),score=101.42 c6984_g1_i2:34-924(+)